MSTLTNGQLLALEHFIDHHGRRWRANLAWAWCSAARVQGVTEDEAACLQQLRNLYGQTWLNAYRPGDTQVGWLQYTPQRLQKPGRPNYRIMPPDFHAGDEPLAVGVGVIREAKAHARKLNITLIEDPR